MYCLHEMDFNSISNLNDKSTAGSQIGVDKLQLTNLTIR